MFTSLPQGDGAHYDPVGRESSMRDIRKAVEALQTQFVNHFDELYEVIVPNEPFVPKKSTGRSSLDRIAERDARFMACFDSVQSRVSEQAAVAAKESTLDKILDELKLQNQTISSLDSRMKRLEDTVAEAEKQRAATAQGAHRLQEQILAASTELKAQLKFLGSQTANEAQARAKEASDIGERLAACSSQVDSIVSADTTSRVESVQHQISELSKQLTEQHVGFSDSAQSSLQSIQASSAKVQAAQAEGLAHQREIINVHNDNSTAIKTLGERLAAMQCLECNRCGQCVCSRHYGARSPRLRAAAAAGSPSVLDESDVNSPPTKRSNTLPSSHSGPVSEDFASDAPEETDRLGGGGEAGEEYGLDDPLRPHGTIGARSPVPERHRSRRLGSRLEGRDSYEDAGYASPDMMHDGLTGMGPIEAAEDNMFSPTRGTPSPLVVPSDHSSDAGVH